MFHILLVVAVVNTSVCFGRKQDALALFVWHRSFSCFSVAMSFLPQNWSFRTSSPSGTRLTSKVNTNPREASTIWKPGVFNMSILIALSPLTITKSAICKPCGSLVQAWLVTGSCMACAGHPGHIQTLASSHIPASRLAKSILASVGEAISPSTLYCPATERLLLFTHSRADDFIQQRVTGDSRRLQPNIRPEIGVQEFRLFLRMLGKLYIIASFCTPNVKFYFQAAMYCEYSLHTS
jgi:hypothetical protein